MPENRYQFNVFAFFIAFCIGMFYVYANDPQERAIIKYPTPYNVNKLVYRGEADNCYKFKTQEVECKSEYYEQPIV